MWLALGCEANRFWQMFFRQGQVQPAYLERGKARLITAIRSMYYDDDMACLIAAVDVRVSL